MIKKIITLILVLVPVTVNGLTGSVSISCNKTALTIGEETSCKITGKSDGLVSSVSADLNKEGDITITNIVTSSTWQGNGDGGNIKLYGDNHSGSFDIATFKVKANGDGKISLNNIVFSDDKFAKFELDSKTVAITIREKNTDASLKSLLIDGVSIDNFSSQITEYNISTSKSKIKISGSATESTSKISGLGEKTLVLGDNKINVLVTAENSSKKTYTLNVTRIENRELKTLKINGEKITLSNGIYEYDYILNSDTDKIKIDAELMNSDVSFVEGYGPREINYESDTKILVKIEDENKEELLYTINISKEAKEEESVVINNKCENDVNKKLVGVILLLIIMNITLLYIVYKFKKNRSRFF